MVVTCVIEFEKNSIGTFFAGQEINGRVTLEANKAKEVTGIKLEILGFAHTHWTKYIAGRRNSYSGNEEYLHSTTSLLRTENENKKVEIAAGIHSFTFTCLLPLKCPSSFEPKRFGHIRYMIKVSLVRPWKFDQTFSKGFTVIKYMDLNISNPLFKMPHNVKQKKTFLCGPCQSDPLIIDLVLNKTGFVPGQHIEVQAIITNDSHVALQEIILELALNVKFSVDYSVQTKEETIIVQQLKGEHVLRNSKKLYNFSLPVPATPPTDVTNSKLIQLTYEVRLTTRTKGAYVNKMIKIPVVIGSILHPEGLIQQQPANTVRIERELMNAMVSNQSDPQPALLNGVHDRELAVMGHWDSNMLPNYEEALHMSHAELKDDNDYGEKVFKPKYPVFKMSEAFPENNTTENGTWL